MAPQRARHGAALTGRSRADLSGERPTRSGVTDLALTTAEPSDAASGGVSLPACTRQGRAHDSHSVSWAIARSGESSVTASLAPDLLEHVPNGERDRRVCVCQPMLTGPENGPR
jgi:hypothetical protein